jgi:hypothetical protein
VRATPPSSGRPACLRRLVAGVTRSGAGPPGDLSRSIRIFLRRTPAAGRLIDRTVLMAGAGSPAAGGHRSAGRPCAGQRRPRSGPHGQPRGNHPGLAPYGVRGWQRPGSRRFSSAPVVCLVRQSNATAHVWIGAPWMAGEDPRRDRRSTQSQSDAQNRVPTGERRGARSQRERAGPGGRVAGSQGRYPRTARRQSRTARRRARAGSRHQG